MFRVPSISGVYGEDCYDGGGVYGADFVNEGPIAPVVITKIGRRQSKESDANKQQNHHSSTTPKETTATSTAKSSRKQSKDTTMAADLERAYLISAANECHSGEETSVNAVENRQANPAAGMTLANSDAQPTTTQPSSGAPTTTTKHHHHNQHSKHAKLSAYETNVVLDEKPLKSSIISSNNEHSQTQMLTQQSTITSSNSGFSMNNTSTVTTTPRKPAFNPLHVILKDKNKYHTTEYI